MPTDDKIKLVFSNTAPPEKSSCRVVMNGVALHYDEFVVVGYNETKGTAELTVNADAMTLLHATLMLAAETSRAMAELDEETRNEVQEIVRGALGDHNS